MNNYQVHKSVLIKEVLEALNPKDGEVFIDGTFGAGGYTRAILEAANCRVFGLDRDQNVEKFAKELKKEFGDKFNFIKSPFSLMEECIPKLLESSKDLLRHAGPHKCGAATIRRENKEIYPRLESLGYVDQKVDGIVLDLGVSSMQLDEEGRGFSFSSSAKLDMRMDSSSGISAFEVVNEFEEVELSKIIRDFGEEKKHRIIVKKIVEARQKGPINTGLELAEIVKKVYGFQVGKIHPATKTFQAIRIFVNDELGELQRALEASKQMLKKDGRLVVVSFHSLEDSLVKSFLREESGYNDRNFSRYEPQSNSLGQQKIYNFSLPKGSSIKPSEAELKENIRSRSARLRSAIKI